MKLNKSEQQAIHILLERFFNKNYNNVAKDYIDEFGQKDYERRIAMLHQQLIDLHHKLDNKWASKSVR